jgi:DNA excision repair protein ERCC-6-like 2
MLDYLMMCKSYLYAKLDGSMDLDERTPSSISFLTIGTKVVDQFNNDPQMFVFLISTKAGGVGLNIVSANKVYRPVHPHLHLTP